MITAIGKEDSNFIFFLEQTENLKIRQICNELERAEINF